MSPSSASRARIACLPGDCIGPEVMAVAKRVLGELAPDLELTDHPFGAGAIRATGDPLPATTLEACRNADAVLKAPIGDPEFDAADVRPEQGMLQLRAELDVYANLRPASLGAVDLLIVRELVGGIYFGARGVREDGTVACVRILSYAKKQPPEGLYDEVRKNALRWHFRPATRGGKSIRVVFNFMIQHKCR